MDGPLGGLRGRERNTIAYFAKKYVRKRHFSSFIKEREKNQLGMQV